MSLQKKNPSSACCSSTSPTDVRPRRLVTSPALQPFPELSNQKLSLQAKKLVYTVYTKILKRHPQVSVEPHVGRSARSLVFSERSVFRIKLGINTGTLKSPKGKRLRLPVKDDRAKTGNAILQHYDSFSLAALRKKAHQYFLRNEILTAAKLAQDVASDSDMNMPKMSMRLSDISFAFRKRKINYRLLEKNDIVTWRREYLRTLTFAAGGDGFLL
ncbi:uncharacterized protein LOC144144130 [Haemaphysalis longicornis]